MRHTALAVVVLLCAAGIHAAGPVTPYKAPRTGDGRPDLQGVWNFSSDVPLERPAAFAGKKFFTREELERQRVAKDQASTSLITYPDNGRLPKLVDGVRRAPGAEQTLEALVQRV